MNVYKIFEKEFVTVSGEKKQLETILTERQFGKVYLMLGINELGYDFDRTVSRYADLLAKIRGLQPEALIFLEANLHITGAKSEDSPIYTNENINRFNQAAEQMADGQSIFYLDVNELFDDENGNLAFTLEAAHSMPRILHAGGDSTGRVIEDKLAECVRKSDSIEVYEGTIAVELLCDNKNTCRGVLVYNPNTDSYEAIYSNAVVLATGGVGQVYEYTTNPAVATADGVALAHLAGAEVSDMEFVQFHPTALKTSSGSKNMPLVSEAVRGEGAKLLNTNKESFMQMYDKREELAPRDVVARAIFHEMERTNSKNVFLDISPIGLERFKKRFPSITSICNECGIDLEEKLIPVAPAAHYFMGGVKVNLNMETSVKNLYAIGEVSRTGLHGANRLASNSLLECVVCAYKLSGILSKRNLDAPKSFDGKVKSILELYDADVLNDIIETGILRRMLKKAMWENAGIIRNKTGLKNALRVLDDIALITRNSRVYASKEGYELRNSLIAAKLIAEAALVREDSIGAHYREDTAEDVPQTTDRYAETLGAEVSRI